MEGRNQRKIENNIELQNLITKEQDFFAFKEAKSKPNYIGTKIITSEIMLLNDLKKNFENNAFTETDITDRLKIITENLDTSQIVIGFMIDNKKRLLLN